MQLVIGDSGFKTVVAMVKALIEEMNITVPVAIHLDHGSSFEKCKEAIDAGFTTVDDWTLLTTHSKKTLKLTKKVVEYAHARNVSVEAGAWNSWRTRRRHHR